MNVADTERAATKLRAAGYDLAESESEADVLIFNTCSVRAKAAQKVFHRIEYLKSVRSSKIGRPIIGIMGCVAQLEGEAVFDHESAIDFVAGTRATDRLGSLIERARDGEGRVIDLGERSEGEGWNVSPVERHSPHVAFVPIIEGCNKFCTYCIVPYSRGRERSRVASDIVREIHGLLESGFKEVHLIGQNVNSYRPKSEEGLLGIKGATPFSKLLRAVARTGIERIKFTTSFPRDFHEDIVAAIDEHDNLCNWVHLPVQSGSDRILRRMRRGYSSSDYLSRVQCIKRAGRPLSLTTDIIVGFPGESTSDFEDTLRLVENCQYHGLYIFKYSERPGTPASRLQDDVSREEKRARFLSLESLQRNIQSRIYSGYIGEKVKVLVEGESAKSENDLTGHTTCHKVLNFPGDSSLVGKIVEVIVTEAKVNSLYGRVVDGSPAL